MWLKLGALGGMGRVNLPLWTYRVHPGQMTANPARMCESYAQVLKDFLKKNPHSRSTRAFAHAYYHYDASLAYQAAGMKLNALLHSILSLAAHPWPLNRGNSEKRFHRISALLKT